MPKPIDTTTSAPPASLVTSLSALLLALAPSLLLAQTVTVADLLAGQTAKKSAGQVALKPVREPADVWLSAIYGANNTLVFDMLINQRQQTLQLGQTLRHNKTACTLASFDEVSRCLVITQASNAGDSCPAKACWTGSAPPARLTPPVGQSLPPAAANSHATRTSPVTSIAPINGPNFVVPGILGQGQSTGATK